MRKEVKYLAIAYVLMLLVIFLLPFFSEAGYSIAQNTTSQLGAQNTPNAWIMNLIFVILGLASIAAGWNLLRGYWLQRITLAVFGLSLVFTAFYHHAPLNRTLKFNIKEDKLHSFFASATGFSFILFAFAMGFVLKGIKEKAMAFGSGILSTILSLLMLTTPALMGIWQRLIFIAAFGWMIYLFGYQKAELPGSRGKIL